MSMRRMLRCSESEASHGVTGGELSWRRKGISGVNMTCFSLWEDGAAIMRHAKCRCKLGIC